MGGSGTEWENERRALEKLREELTALVTAAAEGSRPVDLDEPIGRISRVDAMQQQKMVAVNRQAAQQRRRQVEAALARIEAGEYGECQSCGEEINLRRLAAQPEAPLCLDCQSRREKRA
jgi:DnaK suppressor protein